MLKEEKELREWHWSSWRCKLTYLNGSFALIYVCIYLSCLFTTYNYWFLCFIRLGISDSEDEENSDHDSDKWDAMETQASPSSQAKAAARGVWKSTSDTKQIGTTDCIRLEGQDKFVMRELDNADVGLREDCEEDLVDVGCNADIYVANQESTDSIHEVHVEDALFAFLMGQVPRFISVSLA